MDVVAGPLVCVVVLNCNGREHLEYCLPSICATEYEHLRVLVVDNGSSDDSLAVARRFPVDIAANARNIGWAGGNNVGIRRAIEMGADYLVLANNDIKVDPRWITEAVRLAEVHPDIAVVGFDVHEPIPGSTDTDSGFTAACDAWREPVVTPPTFVGGMAMFARVRTFEELGLIDENFFLYGEENDFQIRVRRAGYQVVAVNVPVWHFGQAFFGKTSLRASLLQTENNIQLLLKHQGVAALPMAAFRHATRRLVAGRSIDRASAVERRLAAGGTARAAVLAPLALLRIALKLPSIVRRKREDNRRIVAVLKRPRALSTEPPLR
jgi:GT2 family glycosyltransferase